MRIAPPALCCLTALALMTGAGRAQTPGPATGLAAPVAFAPDEAGTQVRIHLVDYAAIADETWFLAAPCYGAPEPTMIRIVQFPAWADVTVYLAPHALQADRVLCLASAEGVPAAFLPADPG